MKIDEINSKKWEALFRGAVLSSTTSKFVQYISIADQRAQALIAINAVLIPIYLNALTHSQYFYGAILGIITAVLTIFIASYSLFPRRSLRKRRAACTDRLHFTCMGNKTSDEFLREMQPYFNDTKALATIALEDVHFMASHILDPKYHWLKVSFLTFVIGNFFVVSIILIFSLLEM